jgi:acyl-CoA-binding protein
MNISDQLEAAAAKVKTLDERPANDVLLKLYAFYKQASEGDVGDDKPAMFDFVATAKYNAWSAVKGLKNEEATQKYVDLVNSLFEQK